MIYFVGISLFLRITQLVAMETMHFHIAKIILFSRTIFSHVWGPNEQFGTHEKLSWVRGFKVGQN